MITYESTSLVERIKIGPTITPLPEGHVRGSKPPEVSYVGF